MIAKKKYPKKNLPEIEAVEAMENHVLFFSSRLQMINGIPICFIGANNIHGIPPII